MYKVMTFFKTQYNKVNLIQNECLPRVDQVEDSGFISVN